MYETAIEMLVSALCAYLATGLAFGLVFAFAGVNKIDSQAQGTGLGFRLIIIPGAAALWPALLYRWVRKLPAPVERNPHR
jgi:hypothetical protein